MKFIKYRDQKILEEKRREELLNSSIINETPDHVQLFLENDQHEIRHHNRLTRANNGKFIFKFIFLSYYFYLLFD